MNREAIRKYFGTWEDVVAPFVETANFDQILADLKKEKADGRQALPAQSNIFRAFTTTPLDQVRIVILGQDPYPSESLANGLAFAIPAESQQKVPASLQKIVDKIEEECYSGLNFEKENFDVTLEAWTKQGIMLLNSALTLGSRFNPEKNVEVFTPGSHTKLWQPFTQHVINTLADIRKNTIFLGWGATAQELLKDVSVFHHYVMICEHPSIAAKEKRAWNNNFHFSKANACIRANRLGEPIKW